MARVTSMTLRMLRLLDAERAARHESDRHAAENARLLATLTERQQMFERLAEEQARLRRVATLVAGQAAADDVFAAVAEEAARLLRADAGGLCRYEPDGSLLVMASWSERGAHIPTGTRLELEDNSIGATVLRSGGTARVDRYDRVSGRLAAFARELGIRSSVGAPVIVDGRVWGVMVAAASRREPLPSESEQRLACFTELVATAISNTQALGELRASRARVVAAADEVRRRIERNLHDGAQQRLVSLALMLRQAEATVPPEGDALRGTIASVYDDLNGVVTDLQEISRGLHPTILSQGGLQRALTTLARRSVVPVELHVGVDGRLPEPTEVTAYYVVAETLTNAAKHASASVVRVDVHRQNDELTVSVRDDGAGGADPAAGSGLVGLTDRVEALGGTISISSPPGDGTSLVVTVPIDAD
jgi:signal transduction histidine kinase